MGQHMQKMSASIRTIVDRLLLKQYGDNLLEPGAAFWIFIARMVVLLIATCEAASWGYLAHFLGAGLFGIVAGVATFTTIFLLVWAVDATLLMLDSSRPFYHLRLYGEETKEWKNYVSFAGAVLSRVGIATLSLIITAPFLANMVFNADIIKELQVESASAIAAGRDKLAYKADRDLVFRNDQVMSLQGRLAVKREQRAREVSGRGLSSKYGEGPVSRAIQAEIDALERELINLENEPIASVTEIRDYEHAVATERYDVLRQRWLVILPENSITKRGEILKRITATPTYTNTEVAIQSLLAFLLVSLLILKLFQPRSVRIYCSEALQAEWRRYLAGAIDLWIKPGERSNAHPRSMTAFRFEDLMLNCYPAIREADLRRIKASEARAQIADVEILLNDLEHGLRSKSLRADESREKELAKAIAERTRIEDEARQIDAKKLAVARAVLDTKKHLKEFSDQAVRLYGLEIAKQRIKLENQLAGAIVEEQVLNDELQMSRDRLRFLGRRIEQLERFRDNAEEQFSEFRRVRNELIRSVLDLLKKEAKIG